jgi:hypothetical protein
MDLLFVILFVLLGLLFVNSFKNKLSPNNLSSLKQLYVYHLLFGIYYYFFILGDSIGYWQQPKVKGLRLKHLSAFLHSP